MAKTIVLSREARKALDQMPNNVESLIRSKLRQLAADPRALTNNIKALKSSDLSRLRVGSWRVLFRSDAEHVNVLAIGSRGSIYE